MSGTIAHQANARFRGLLTWAHLSLAATLYFQIRISNFPETEIQSSALPVHKLVSVQAALPPPSSNRNYY